MQDALSLKFAALADPTRRAILARLALGEATVTDLNQPFAMSQPAISKHLRILEAAGLVETVKRAQARPRRLKPEGLNDAVGWVQLVRRSWHESFDRLDALLAEIHQTSSEG